MTLTEFLLARIAEDQELAREANQRKGGSVQGWGYYDADLGDFYMWGSNGNQRHGVNWPRDNNVGLPERVLAECKAKRQIVEHRGGDRLGVGNPLDPLLRFLALPYAGHADYQEGWRP